MGQARTSNIYVIRFCSRGRMRRGLERAAARPTSVATGKRLKSQDEDPCHGTCPGARCSVSQSVHKMCEIGSRSRHILSGRLLMRHGGAPLYLAPRNLQFRSNDWAYQVSKLLTCQIWSGSFCSCGPGPDCLTECLLSQSKQASSCLLACFPKKVMRILKVDHLSEQVHRCTADAQVLVWRGRRTIIYV